MIVLALWFTQGLTGPDPLVLSLPFFSQLKPLFQKSVHLHAHPEGQREGDRKIERQRQTRGGSFKERWPLRRERQRNKHRAGGREGDRDTELQKTSRGREDRGGDREKDKEVQMKREGGREGGRQ